MSSSHSITTSRVLLLRSTKLSYSLARESTRQGWFSFLKETISVPKTDSYTSHRFIHRRALRNIGPRSFRQTCVMVATMTWNEWESASTWNLKKPTRRSVKYPHLRVVVLLSTFLFFLSVVTYSHSPFLSLITQEPTKLHLTEAHFTSDKIIQEHLINWAHQSFLFFGNDRRVLDTEFCRRKQGQARRKILFDSNRRIQSKSINTQRTLQEDATTSYG